VTVDKFTQTEQRPTDCSSTVTLTDSLTVAALIGVAQQFACGTLTFTGSLTVAALMRVVDLDAWY